MLFPNFYVSSVGLKMVTLRIGSRMSLTHFDGRQAGFWAFCHTSVRINPPTGGCPSQDHFEPLQFEGRISGFLQRVDPPQPLKAGEIAIRGVQHSAVFNGESGQFCIGGKGTANLSLYQHPLEDGPMTLSRHKQANLFLLHPLLHNADRHLH